MSYPPHLIPNGGLGGWGNDAWEYLAMWCPNRLEALGDPETALGDWELRFDEEVARILGPIPNEPEARAAWCRQETEVAAELFERWKPAPEVSTPVWDPDPDATSERWELLADVTVTSHVARRLSDLTPLAEVLDQLDPATRSRWDEMMAHLN